ncbi:MAG: hypothetical protein FWG87_05220 [Defluviitaleaceae bacterium]|nr:hypothetical protein [Defluviitaleaceae bacterium]
MVFLDNTARRPTQSEVISGRINPSPTKTVTVSVDTQIAWFFYLRGFKGMERGFARIYADFVRVNY